MNLITSAALCLAVWLCTLPAATAGTEPPVMETVEYLIRHTAESGLTFIRNGSEHSAAEAADLMRKKLGFVKAQVHTPEDFIRLAASQSHFTGQPYLVRLPDGQTVPSADWLAEALRSYRASRGH